MKKSTKAALLSALVFPGLGHIYLKKYLPGLVLAGASFAALYYLIADATDKAFEIVDKLQSGDAPADIDSITAMLSQQPAGADAQLLNVATIALVICWLVGIVDSYRVGSAADKKNDDPKADRTA